LLAANLLDVYVMRDCAPTRIESLKQRVDGFAAFDHPKGEPIHLVLEPQGDRQVVPKALVHAT
jgi:hypothetical protein